MNDDYKRQRVEGSQMIIKELVEESAARGVKVTFAEWDGGKLSDSEDTHSLRAEGNGKSIEGEFADEWVADYPGKVGLARAQQVVRGMAMKLAGK